MSTPTRPKQLLPLASDRPLIVDAVERARLLAPDARIRVLAPAAMAAALARAVPSLGPETFWSEPEPKGTAPALAWAAWRIRREDPDAVMVSLHADHVIEPPEAFRAGMLEAARLAHHERLLFTVGARPDRPDVGFGYVEPGPTLPARDAFAAQRVTRFHEKPDAATASAYVSRGYLWNTGLFVWPVGLFLDEVERHAPELARALHALEGDEGAEAFFRQAPPGSVDVVVLERSERVGVLAAPFRWDDVGSWEAVARTRAADPGGNTLHGEVHAVDASRNIAFTDGAPVVLFGVDDLVVVRTDKVTLVASRSRTPDLKTLLERLPETLRTLDG